MDSFGIFESISNILESLNKILADFNLSLIQIICICIGSAWLSFTKEGSTLQEKVIEQLYLDFLSTLKSYARSWKRLKKHRTYIQCWLILILLLAPFYMYEMVTEVEGFIGQETSTILTTITAVKLNQTYPTILRSRKTKGQLIKELFDDPKAWNFGHGRVIYGADTMEHKLGTRTAYLGIPTALLPLFITIVGFVVCLALAALFFAWITKIERETARLRGESTIKPIVMDFPNPDDVSPYEAATDRAFEREQALLQDCTDTSAQTPPIASTSATATTTARPAINIGRHVYLYKDNQHAVTIEMAPVGTRYVSMGDNHTSTTAEESFEAQIRTNRVVYAIEEADDEDDDAYTQYNEEEDLPPTYAEVVGELDEINKTYY